MNRSNVHELGLMSLIYVSRSTLAIEGDADAVNEIVSKSNSRNGPQRVTGAMIYTELHFAQVLEGPSRAIEELMSKIRRDKRHRDVTVLEQKTVAKRKFEDWAMAYSGPSPHLDRHIKPLISPVTLESDRLALLERLITFMEPPAQDDTQRVR